MKKFKSVRELALKDICQDVNYKGYVSRYKSKSKLLEDFNEVSYAILDSKENRYLNRELGISNVNMKGGKK